MEAQGQFPAQVETTQRLSLLWKLLIPCVLVIAAITGLMALQNWQLLSAQLVERTKEQLAGDERVLVNLFDQMRNEYAHIGTELSAVIDESAPQRLHAYIENSPDIFARLNWLSVYDTDQRLLSRWVPFGLQADFAETIRADLLAQAGAALRPIGRIHCAADCEFVIAMPAIKAQQQYLLLLAAPLADVVPTYAALTGAELALLVQAANTRSRLVAQSPGGAMPTAFLVEVTSGQAGEQYGERWFNDRFIAYRLADLSSVSSKANVLHTVLIRDLTDKRAASRAQALRQLMLESLVALIGTIFLLWLISRNLKRLSRVTAILPMLSEAGAYQQTREALSRAFPHSRWGDEVDTLRSTLSWLSERLEQLHGAEAASDAKSRFLATMSHEIRTPMGGILGLAEILNRTPLSDDQRRMSQMIQDSTVNLLSIINDVLDYSRIEAGAAEVEAHEFDPVALVESVVDMVAVTASNKGLRLKLLTAPDVPAQTRGDLGKIRQILLNLLSNAIKFTAQGAVTMQLSVDWQVADQCRLCFAVQDTGIGIPEEAQAKIFQRFSQADSSTTRRFGGSGLGLAICDGLASLMGGSIELESAPGQGACFRFFVDLPVLSPASAGLPSLQDCLVNLQLDADETACWGAHLRAAGAALGGQASAETRVVVDLRDDPSGDRSCVECRHSQDGQVLIRKLSRPIKPARLAAMIVSLGEAGDEESVQTLAPQLTQFSARILVVEDQAVNRELLGRQLQQLGCEVVLVEHGRQALDELRRGHFDLLISDLHMPVMDGYELARNLAQHHDELVRKMPIVLLTASASPQDLARLRTRGIARKLIKPVRLSELEHCLLELGLDTTSDSAPPAEQASSAQEAAASEPLVLDLDLVREVIGDDLSDLGSYVELFEQTCRPLLQQCREALEGQDLAELAALAHRLKGSSRSLGGLRLAQRLQQLESALPQQDVAALGVLLDKTEVDFEEFLAALNTAG